MINIKSKFLVPLPKLRSYFPAPPPIPGPHFMSLLIPGQIVLSPHFIPRSVALSPWGCFCTFPNLRKNYQFLLDFYQISLNFLPNYTGFLPNHTGFLPNWKIYQIILDFYQNKKFTKSYWIFTKSYWIFTKSYWIFTKSYWISLPIFFFFSNCDHILALAGLQGPPHPVSD